MIEYLLNPFLAIVFIANPYMLMASPASNTGLDPSIQRDRASITTARSNVASICQGQVICIVEHDYDMDQCSSFGPDNVDVVDPSGETWTYTFDGMETQSITAKGTLSGTTFTLTCNNTPGSLDIGRVTCSSNGLGSRSCESLGL